MFNHIALYACLPSRLSSLPVARTVTVIQAKDLQAESKTDDLRWCGYRDADSLVYTHAVKPLFERRLHLNATSNRTPLQVKG